MVTIGAAVLLALLVVPAPWGLAWLPARSPERSWRRRSRDGRHICRSRSASTPFRSPEAAAYVEQRYCRVLLLPTPEAIGAWNQAQGKAIGLFHVAC
jgi:hypothetical protein